MGKQVGIKNMERGCKRMTIPCPNNRWQRSMWVPCGREEVIGGRGSGNFRRP